MVPGMFHCSGGRGALFERYASGARGARSWRTVAQSTPLLPPPAWPSWWADQSPSDVRVWHFWDMRGDL